MNIFFCGLGGDERFKIIFLIKRFLMSIEIKLKEWARWKLQTNVALGFPRQSSHMRLSVDGSRRTKDSIDAYNLDCVNTNEAVESLPAFQNFVIRLEYISNVRDMKTKLEMVGAKNKKTYYHYLNDAYQRLNDIL